MLASHRVLGAQIREYFGEKMALYFAWVGFLTSSLAFLSCVAVCSGAYSVYTFWISGEMFNKGSVAYAIFAPAWVNATLELWKRKEHKLAMYWGMHDYEHDEMQRPEYYGENIKSYIDGDDMKYFPSHIVSHL